MEGGENSESLIIQSENQPQELDKSPPKENQKKKNGGRKREFKGARKNSIPHNIISDEPRKRFILEISVAKNPPAPVYWYNNSAFEKIENSISLMRAELIYSRVVSHAQSKPLLN